MNMSAGLAGAVIGGWLLSGCAPRNCPCLQQIPAGLQAQLLKQFPEDRLPTQGDSRAEDIRYNIQQGGNGCLLVAAGDFDDNHQQDVALVMLSKDGQRLRLVTALQNKDMWEVESLDSWSAKDDHPYILALGPGKYERTPALQGPLRERGERMVLESQLSGFVHGTIESSACAYFYQNKRWVHVWISD